jgi:hypothetical protein
MRITLQNIDRMTDEELENAITACFDASPEVTQIDRLAILLEAQFYRTEKYKRVDDKAQTERDRIETDRWRIDLKNEKIIIGMIAAEIILSLVAIWLGISSDHRQSRDAEEQMKEFKAIETNLVNLQKSSQATADTISALKQTTDAMNSGIQTELSLKFDVELEVTFDNERGRIELVNRGSTNLYIWGLKVNDSKAMIEKEGKLLAPGSQYYYVSSVIETPARPSVPDGSHKLFPFLVLVKNVYDIEFIVEATMFAEWKNNVLALSVVSTKIRKANWSGKSPISFQVP